MLNELAFPYLESFIRLLYPAYCGACQGFLELRERDICQSCSLRLEKIRLPFDQCVLDEPFSHVDQAWAVFPYESPVKELIGGIKFLKKSWITRVFSAQMAEVAAMMSAETGYDAIVPIPMDRFNLAKREFNQASGLAEMISRIISIRVEENFLSKPWMTAPQSSLNRQKRKKNLSGRFKTFHPKKIIGKTILLVDDIVTTGATAEEAARILKQAGAKKVDLFSLARTFADTPS